MPLDDNSPAFQNDTQQRGSMAMTPAHQPRSPGVCEGWATLPVRPASVPIGLPAADAH